MLKRCIFDWLFLVTVLRLVVADAVTTTTTNTRNTTTTTNTNTAQQQPGRANECRSSISGTDATMIYEDWVDCTYSSSFLHHYNKDFINRTAINLSAGGQFRGDYSYDVRHSDNCIQLLQYNQTDTEEKKVSQEDKSLQMPLHDEKCIHFVDSTCSHYKTTELLVTMGNVTTVEWDIAVPVADNYNNTITDNDTIEANLQEIDNGLPTASYCRVYLAESTIPGAGLGMFAGTHFNKNDEVTISGDAIVPLLNLPEGTLIHEYSWVGNVVHDAYVFGIGAIPNCFFPLVNVDFESVASVQSSIEEDEFVLSFNPGVGASTVHYATSSPYATRPIYAGEEIFISYGEGYFEGRETTKFGKIPFERHYRVADNLLHLYRNNVNAILLDQEKFQCPLHNQTYTNEPGLPLLKHSSTVPIVPLAVELYELVKFIVLSWPANIQSALPMEVSGINHLLDNGAKTTAMNFHGRSIRPIEDIQKTGSCMDHLVIGQSTIPYAGRGAFANKFLQAGTTVAPIPLMHVPDRSLLNIYENSVNNQTRDDSVHYQLLLNYCYGHRESTILLCPYGIASALVNHAPNGKANVRLAWSTKLTRDPSWLNMSIDEWKYEFHAGLTFEYVAISDIQEGEEVLFDYGTEWQHAWDEYVNHAFPTTSQYMYQTLNEQYPPVEIPTGKDAWPWGASVTLWCRTVYLVISEGFHLTDIEDDTPSFHPCRVIATRINAETNETLYTAELLLHEHNDLSDDVYHDDSVTTSTSTTQIPQEDQLFCFEFSTGNILFNVPRDAFVFGNQRFNILKSKPIYNEAWTFRHDIRIPDDIMPKSWRNSEQ